MRIYRILPINIIFVNDIYQYNDYSKYVIEQTTNLEGKTKVRDEAFAKAKAEDKSIFLSIGIHNWKNSLVIGGKQYL
jgi:hypothetical protein